MKICHVINDLSRGGAESHLYSLVKLQREAGHDISVMLLGSDLKYFTIVGNTENIFEFEKKVNSFFDKKIKFPQIQIGGNKFNLNLDKSQLDKIKKIYTRDFNLLETLKK